jgi:hypothetical protein
MARRRLSVLPPTHLFHSLTLHAAKGNGYKSDPVSSDWEGMIKSHIWSHDDNVPRFRHGTWRNVFGEKGQTYFQTPIQEEHESHTQWGTPKAIWDRLNTYSIFSTAEESVLKVCLSSLRRRGMANGCTVGVQGEV